MKLIPKFCIALIGFCALTPALQASAQSGGTVFFCQNETKSWTIYESTQPRMFQQEIGVAGPGEFTLTVTANGFGFEGFSYAKSQAWEDWQFVQKTFAGKRQWTQSWRIADERSQIALLQLIKDNNDCKNCTITMQMTSSNCPNNNRGATRGAAKQ